MNIITYQILSWRMLGMLSLLPLLVGCGSKDQGLSDEVIEQNYSINPTARLSIRNPRGSISIRGTDMPELRLHAMKKANSAAQLKNIGVSVAAQTGSVSISTVYLSEKKSMAAGPGTVDYLLLVPRTVTIVRVDLDDGQVVIDGMEGEDVRANVVDGKLTIRNCCGNVHVAIANGDLNLFYERCAGRQFSTDAQVTNGNAGVLISRRASFSVHAQTDSGKITNELTETVEINRQSSRKVNMSFGKDARSEVNLRVTVGDIKIAEAKPEIESSGLTADSVGNP